MEQLEGIIQQLNREGVLYDTSSKHILLCGDCIAEMDRMIKYGVQVDMTITSPPYDDIRTYDHKCEWNFDVFKQVADRLYKVTRPGGVVVWVVNDQVKNQGETLTSFRQAIYFTEIGFKMHDTMIYEKNSSAFAGSPTSKRYSQIFEYMFVFVKGKIRDDIQLICDKPNKYAGFTSWGKCNSYDKEGNLVEGRVINPVPEFSLRNNIWKYTTSCSKDKKFGRHPAVFPEKLAEDHILSWCCEGDVVFDPMMGSGTAGKMAILNGRKFIGVEINDTYFGTAVKRINYYENSVETDKVNYLPTKDFEDEEADYNGGAGKTTHPDP